MGINGIVEHITEWLDLAMWLGVPIPKVSCYKDSVLGGQKALQYWRDGRCREDFPTTWQFLLKTVKDHYGCRVAQQLKDKVESNATWSE